MNTRMMCLSESYTAPGDLGDRIPRELAACLVWNGVEPSHRMRIVSAVAAIVDGLEGSGASIVHLRVEPDAAAVRVSIEAEGSEAIGGDEVAIADCLAERLEILNTGTAQHFTLAFELFETSFSEEADLSELDYLDPLTARALVATLRGDETGHVELPMPMASTVGRLLSAISGSSATETVRSLP